MMTLVVGIGNLLIGTAYAGLGLLSAWEAFSQYRYRGLSRFGLGFSLMAASCGPHHLLHGWCVLQGGAVSPAMLAMTLIGLPAGLVFCLLRAEAMLGGHGERVVTARPAVVGAVTGAFLVSVGVLVGWSMTAVPAPPQIICTTQGLQLVGDIAGQGPEVTSVITWTNLFVVVTYGMVGWYMLDTQVQRYVRERAWSLSGLSLAAVFPTCAAMHLILAASGSRDAATILPDLLGVPASVYFLWVVRRLHADSVVDWNRRPLIGVASMPARSAPWSDPSAAMNSRR